MGLGGRDVAVDEAGMVEMHLILKFYEIRDIADAENVGEQRRPEQLAFALLITFARPILRELLCSFLLLFIRKAHSSYLRNIIL